MPITLSDLRAFQKEIVADVTRIVATTSTSSDQNHDSAEGPEESETFELFNWKDGKVGHAVPKGWVYPKALTPKIQWILWHFGDRLTRICPYKRTHENIISSQRQIKCPSHALKK